MLNSGGVGAMKQNPLPPPPSISKNKSELKSSYIDSVWNSWDFLANNLIRKISDLNYSIKNVIKTSYIRNCSQIARLAKDLLAFSGAADSQLVRINQNVEFCQKQVMVSLSKLILAAKISSGIWPPPDNIINLQYHTDQFLSSAQDFIANAKSLGAIITHPTKEKAESLDILEKKLTGEEFISQLDQSSESIQMTMAALTTQISKENNISNSSFDLIWKFISKIGQIMSLIEGIHIDNSKVKDCKTKLYVLLNGLASLAGIFNNDLSTSNSTKSILDHAEAALESIEDLRVACKILIDQNDYMIEKSYTLETDSKDLAKLQQRVQTFANNENSEPITLGISHNIATDFSGNGKPFSSTLRNENQSPLGNSFGSIHTTSSIGQVLPNFTVFAC
jgi:hypothetical protein